MTIEYFRPWKLFSLACGIGLLIAGADYWKAPDWDIPVSFLMAILAYLFAPWTLRVVLERQWEMLLPALVATWFTIDGAYALYWMYVDAWALEQMRAANFFASLSLYGACGLVWLHRGPLSTLETLWKKCPSAPNPSSRS